MIIDNSVAKIYSFFQLDRTTRRTVRTHTFRTPTLPRTTQKMAQWIGMVTDKATSGFGTTYHPAHVNYYRMFKEMDTDCTQFIEKDEFTYVIRKVLGIPKKGTKNHAVS